MNFHLAFTIFKYLITDNAILNLILALGQPKYSEAEDPELHRPHKLTNFLGNGPGLEPDLGEFVALGLLDQQKHVQRFNASIALSSNRSFNRYDNNSSKISLLYTC